MVLCLSRCPNTSEDLHYVLSDTMGEPLLEIKFKTHDDHVRTSVSDLERAGNASVLRNTTIGNACGLLSAPSHQQQIVMYS